MQYQSDLMARIAQDRQYLADIKKLCLENFKYLNAKGQRAGFSFFKSSVLTTKLVMLANAMQEKIKACDNTVSFFNIIEDALDTAWALRWNFSEVHAFQAQVEDRSGDKPSLKIETLYNCKEKSKGRFEKQIQEALAVVVNVYGDIVSNAVNGVYEKIDNHIEKSVYAGTEQEVMALEIPKRYAADFPSGKEAKSFAQRMPSP